MTEQDAMRKKGFIVFALGAMTIAMSLVGAVAAPSQDAPLFDRTRQVDTAAAEIAVRTLLRGGETARFRWIRPGHPGAWCGVINAKNAFGGYVGFQRFVLSVNPPLFMTELGDGERFTAHWEVFCK